ncbi:MAG: hypothetical protein IK115_03070 [Lachnospiraceae bacterium]|nr:hypothetical protein [Lachnospiraceae bacterium]
MMFAFIIWTLCSLIFVFIGAGCLRAKEPVGFFTFVKPPAVKDIRKYNTSVAILWFVFSLLLECLGIPFLFAEQNSPLFIITGLGAPFLVIGAAVAYMRIEARFRA